MHATDRTVPASPSSVAVPQPEPPLEIGGLPRLAQSHDRVSKVVGIQNRVFTGDLNRVRTYAYGNDANNDLTMLTLTIAESGAYAPDDYVRTGAYDIPEIQVPPLSRGVARCWSDGRSMTCFWGDARSFLALIAASGIDNTAWQQAFVERFVSVQKRMFGG